MPILNWFNIALGAIPALLVAWLLHTVDVGRIEAKQAIELANQKTALENKCAKDKAITKGANDGLQKQLNDIAGKLAAAKRLHVAHCIIPIAIKTDPTASGGEHAGQNGVSSDWLLEYAAECETYRQERITLEAFIDGVWKDRGQ